MKSLEQLLTNREKLNQQIERLTRDARSLALAEIKQIMADYELSPLDLFTQLRPRTKNTTTAAKPSKKRPPPGTVRYRMPGNDHPLWTWSGYGSKPKWLKNALEANSELSLEDFRVRD